FVNSLLRVLLTDRKCAHCEAGINFIHGRLIHVGDVYCVQQHLLLGGEGYTQHNNSGISTSLPNVALNGLSRGGVVLALKDVATLEGEDKLRLSGAAC